MPAARPSDALSAHAHRVSGICWRIVEGQHYVSTLALVDSIDEQKRLVADLTLDNQALKELVGKKA